MKVIGLTGLKGSGKDAFADRLAYKFQQIGVWCVRGAFADALKVTLQHSMYFTAEQLSLPHLKEVEDLRWGLTPRQAMRIVGESFREKISPDFWVRRLEIDLKIMGAPLLADVSRRVCFLVTDVRNDLEAEWVKRQGKLIRVSRSQTVFDGHSTEEMATRPASFFDLLVDNSGTLADLTAHAEATARSLLPWIQTETRGV